MPLNLIYHNRGQSYENHLRQHENALKKAKKKYADAADQFLLFLPEGVSFVTHTKEGYARYQKRTERPIPVVILEPRVATQVLSALCHP
jgi:hypothetical protein